MGRSGRGGGSRGGSSRGRSGGFGSGHSSDRSRRSYGGGHYYGGGYNDDSGCGWIGFFIMMVLFTIFAIYFRSGEMFFYILIMGVAALIGYSTNGKH